MSLLQTIAMSVWQYGAEPPALENEVVEVLRPPPTHIAMHYGQPNSKTGVASSASAGGLATRSASNESTASGMSPQLTHSSPSAAAFATDESTTQSSEPASASSKRTEVAFDQCK